jgi:putative FmdB family regulatory protein
MPIHDFACRQCGERFQRLDRALTVPTCPRCASTDFGKLLSLPFISSDAVRSRNLDGTRKQESGTRREIVQADRDTMRH